MKQNPTELIHIAKQVKKAIGPFYSFAKFVDRQIENITPYTDTVNLIYDLITYFNDVKDQLMSAFGLEKVRYEIQVSRIEPYAIVKEITKHALNLIKMAETILTKINEKPQNCNHINGKHTNLSQTTRLPNKDDLLKAYLNLEEQIVLLIVWCNSYLNHIYN
jgi:hypothetical protein